MDYKFQSDISWSNGIGLEHQIELEIQLELPSLFEAKNVAVELAIHQASIRREIFTIAAEHILPKIIRETGVDSDAPEGRLKTKHNAHIKGRARIREIREAGNTIVSIRDRIHALMNITSNRSINAIQALNTNIGNMADAIADDVINHLRRRFLGESQHSNTNYARIVDGKVHETESRRDAGPSNN